MIRARRLRSVTLALILSGVLHSAVLGSAFGPWGAGPSAPRAPAIVLVELPPPRDRQDTAGGLPPAERSEGQAPAAAALARRVEALGEENRTLAEQLAEARRRTAQLETQHREEIAALETAQQHLGEEVAALAADRSALAAAVAAERRHRLGLEQELQGRRQAEQAVQDELEATYDRLVHTLRREIADEEVRVERANERLTVAIVDLVLFPSGQAELTEAGQAVIDRVAAALRQVDRRAVLVEGHTDDVPIGAALRARFASNWELSTARATEVVRRLVDHGEVAGHRLRAVGRADTEPVASNETEEGRRRNRRIEIVLLPPLAARGGEGTSSGIRVLP